MLISEFIAPDVLFDISIYFYTCSPLALAHTTRVISNHMRASSVTRYYTFKEKGQFLTACIFNLTTEVLARNGKKETEAVSANDCATFGGICERTLGEWSISN